MTGYSVAISGINAAQNALDIIANNVANAATEGYHRQRVEFKPEYASEVGSVFVGGGVKITGVTRMIDELLESEILRQKSMQEYVTQESSTLQTVESALGELSTEGGGLNAAIDSFFNALQDLSAHPDSATWQTQVVSEADSMTSQFRTLGDFLTKLEDRLRVETETKVETINSLAQNIADLNSNIEKIEMGGGQANNLCDQRDQCIVKLGELVSVETQSREYGVVDINVAGIPIVTGSSVTELEAGYDSSGNLGISACDSHIYQTHIEGGQVGGLLSLKNETISDIHTKLDSLASALIQQINNYHVQGVGSEGSFTSLTGWPIKSDKLSEIEPPISNGDIYIRVINESTGEVTRNKVSVVDASTDTLSAIAASISNITGLNASVSSSRLNITADAGYKFDFLPAVLPSPKEDTLNLKGSSPPAISVSGIYTGTTNQTFTFTVSGTDSVGNGTLQIEVKDGSNNVVTTVNVGSGYAAGDTIDVGNGLKISLGMGDLKEDDSFQVEAFGNTDETGLLAAVGMNTFFSGTNASNIAVCSDISSEPGRIATSIGPDMTDNQNALRMADLKDEAVSSLGSLTPSEFYRNLVTNVGQQISTKQMQQKNVEAMVKSLSDQQSALSGVDINDEAAQMLVFQQMFQVMAKYMNTVQVTINSIMQLI
jgi:flagellar hook-associated protein 1